MARRLARWLKDEEEEVLGLLQVERLPSFLTFHMDVPSIRQAVPIRLSSKWVGEPD